MANDNVDSFLKVEEYAHRLAEELTRLKSETESYTAARKNLDQAAGSVTALVGSLGEVCGRLPVVVETLRTIGTPELLQRQEVVKGEIVSLRQELSATERSVMEAVSKPAAQLGALLEKVVSLQQELEQRHVSHQQEVLIARKDLSAKVAAGTAAIANVRRLAVGSIGLSMAALAILLWAMITFVRG